jgi:hypothetical protein
VRALGKGGGCVDAEGWGMLGLKKEGFYSIFFKLNRFGSVRFFRFFTYKTKTEPNRLVFLKF